MQRLQLLSLLLAFLTLAAAWPSQEENAVAPGLRKRADGGDSKSSESAAASTGDSAASTGGSAASTTEKSSAAATSGSSQSTGDSNSKSKDESSSNKNSKATKTTGKSATTTEYDPRLPAGGVSMVTPNALSGAEYYKIGNWVTFAWNYTSLSSTPSHIDVLASCSANQATYTIALNQSVQATGTGEVLWDTGAYQSSATVPLLTETYTLIIMDAKSSISATPKAGYLAVYDQFTFGMYIPQKYTSLSSFECATCGKSGALSTFERQTLGFLFGMATITVLTFTWFANSFGVF